MSVPDYQTLMLPVLSAASTGEVRVGDAVDRIAELLALAPEDRAALLPSGRQTVLSNRVHWAKTYLMKAGLVESTRRGHFRITPRGEQVIASQPTRIDNTFLNQFEEFRQFKERSAQSAAEEAGDQPAAAAPAVVNSTETPDEIMRVVAWCMDQGCRRTNPNLALGSGDTDITWASQIQHLVEDMNRQVDISHPTLVYT